MTEKTLNIDRREVREKAMRDVDEGAVTPDYPGDRQAVLAALNEALATELVCVLRYKRHAFVATGLSARPVAAEFEEHAAEEMRHADSIARRIVQLGGEPDFSPVGLESRSHAPYTSPSALDEMIRDNLVAERIAIEGYRRLIRRIGNDDPTTRRMLEEILAMEEEHADDLAGLMRGTSGR